MRRSATVLRISLPLFALVCAAGSAAAFDSAGYEEAITTILCDCGCHPQTVKECACGRAAEMREEILGMVTSGMSGDEVIADYVARHGEKIRVAPVASGFNLLAWLGPLAALVGASAGLFLLVRRWQRRRIPAGTGRGGAEVALPPDDAYVARLRRELEEWE